MSFEITVIKNLLKNEEYNLKVLPYLKEEYFEESSNKIVFEEVKGFVEKYNKIPTLESLKIEIENRDDLFEKTFQDSLKLLKRVSKSKAEKNYDWLVETSEKWCQDRALDIAIRESIKIVDGDDTETGKSAIPEILTDALSVGFDEHLGHDYFEDADKRYHFYTNPETKVPFNIKILDEITKGGFTNKTLNIFLAETGAGKSMTMCHLAAEYISQGKNVVYFTMEMSEEEIGKRIDANLFDIPMDDLEELKENQYFNKINDLKEKMKENSLKIQEFPNGQAHAGHFKNFIKQLKLKKRFVPDVILVDYLSICASMRHSSIKSINHSTYIQSIAEELRALGQEFKCPVISAEQFNREGMDNSDAGLKDIAKSIGITHTADIVLGLLTSEELERADHIKVKQLKNRYGKKSNNMQFILGMNRAKSKLFDINDNYQNKPIEEKKVGKSSINKNKKFEGFTL